MVTITRYESGTCIWCLKQGEGLAAEFKDGLKGFVCKKCFWAAIRVRAERNGANKAAGESDAKLRVPA